jgi:hypothetical protein
VVGAQCGHPEGVCLSLFAVSGSWNLCKALAARWAQPVLVAGGPALLALAFRIFRLPRPGDWETGKGCG